VQDCGKILSKVKIDCAISAANSRLSPRLPGSPTNLRILVETGSHFRMANSPSLPVPIPTRIAPTKAFVWASHVRPIPTSIARTTAKWEPYRPNFVYARDCQANGWLFFSRLRDLSQECCRDIFCSKKVRPFTIAKSCRNLALLAESCTVDGGNVSSAGARGVGMYLVCTVYSHRPIRRSIGLAANRPAGFR
jgi:hypothetical protein